MTLRFRDRILLLVAPPLLLLVGFFIVALGLSERVRYYQVSLRHSVNVILTTAQLQAAMIDSETAVRGYVIAARPEYLGPYRNGAQQANGRLHALALAVADDPARLAAVATIRRVVDTEFRLLRSYVALVANGRQAAAVNALANGPGKTNMDIFRGRVAAFSREDRERLLASREKLSNLANRFNEILGLGALIGIIFTAGSGLALVRFFTSRLHAVSEHARRFTQGIPLTERIGGNDEIAELDATLHDMAERLGAQQQELRTALDAANQAARVKADFVAMLSHEIRTPMNGVIGMTELLLETPLGAEQRELAEAVRDSGSALLHVVNDILDFSKLEAGRLELDVVDFELAPTIEAVTNLFAVAAQTKGIALMSYVAGTIPSVVRGDALRLRQVLLNLVGNAVKFTDVGSVTIYAHNVEASDGGVRVHFSITDTGIGIPLELQESLFEPFQQADPSTTRRFGGTGLGLTISRSLVEMMGGSIEIVSAPGAGSTFSFTVTFARATVPGSRRESVRGARALVVDDDPIAREIILRYAQAWGMRAESAADAQSGRVALLTAYEHGEPFDVVIVDMRMAEMDGLTLGKALREEPRTRETPLILITAFDDRTIAEEAKRIGFVRYLLKPIRQSQLYDAIVAALDARIEAIEPALASQAAEKNVRPQRILLVEDNPVNARLALKQLARLGFAATLVANGKEAVDAVATTSYDLIFMDCHMPVMDGFEATAEIRKRELRTRQHVPIIAMTASARTEDRDACLTGGMDDYLAKPVGLADIQRIVGTWLITSAV